MRGSVRSGGGTGPDKQGPPGDTGCRVGRVVMRGSVGAGASAPFLGWPLNAEQGW